jgi:hypothetical protein
VQAGGGLLRPHKPESGEAPALIRRVWLVSHRVFAALTILLAVYQIYTGPRLLRMYATFQVRWGAFYGVYGACLLVAFLVGLWGYARRGRGGTGAAVAAKKGGVEVVTSTEVSKA